MLKAISKQREHVEQHGKHLIRRGWRTWIHWENLPWLNPLFVGFLKTTGLWRRGFANVLDVQVEQTELAFTDLPELFDGFRILWLSDFHIDKLDGLTEAMLSKVGELDYDICILGGDYSFHHVFTDEAAAHMQQIAAALAGRSEVYAIMGNHDHYAMAEVLDAAGVTVLLNEHRSLERDGHRLHLIGVDDCHYYKAADWHEATAGLNGDGFKVLLSHSPEFQNKIRHADVDLYVCGHTHGGQVCLPGGVAVVTCASVPRHCVKGRWQHKTMTGYTSRGVGASSVPVRFNCPGEITLLTLKAENNHEAHEEHEG